MSETVILTRAKADNKSLRRLLEEDGDRVVELLCVGTWPLSDNRPLAAELVLFRPDVAHLSCCSSVYDEWCPNSNFFEEFRVPRRTSRCVRLPWLTGEFISWPLGSEKFPGKCRASSRISNQAISGLARSPDPSFRPRR